MFRELSRRPDSVDDYAAVLSELNRVPAPTHFDLEALETFIARCMKEVFALSRTGTDDARKMKLVGLEYRARILRDRWKRIGAN